MLFSKIMNGFKLHARMWINLSSVALSKGSQRQVNTYCITPFIRRSANDIIEMENRVKLPGLERQWE